MTPRQAAGPTPLGRVLAAAGEGRGGRPSPAELVATIAALGVMLAAAAVRTGEFSMLSPALLVATVASWAPLLARTYRPVPALVAVVLAESFHLAFLALPASLATANSGMGAYQPVPLGTMVAAYTVASRTPRRVGWVAGIGGGAVLLAVAVLNHPGSLALTDLVMVNLVVIATGLGVMVASRRDRLARDAREREEDKGQAVLDERLRIARELHDVVAHNLTLVNAQAAVAEYLLRTDPEAAATALHDITRHTRRAVDELRSTVGLLRREGDEADPTGGLDTTRQPVAGLDRLEDLVDGFRAAGTPVDLEAHGEPHTLGQQEDIAAYRIVQESLTNATKHAPGATVRVTLRWSGNGLDLDIANDVADQPSGPPARGTGHGLIGMRERALAAGGRLTAGSRPDAGFQVRAWLPGTSAALRPPGASPTTIGDAPAERTPPERNRP